MKYIRFGKAGGQFQKAIGETNTIEWKQFNAGPAEIEALFAGEVDIGYIGPGPAVLVICLNYNFT